MLMALFLCFLSAPSIQAQRNYIYSELYFRFSAVWHNHLRNKHLAEYLRNNSNGLATVRFSAVCGAMLSNNFHGTFYPDNNRCFTLSIFSVVCNCTTDGNCGVICNLSIGTIILLGWVQIIDTILFNLV